jgi:hypothetical protein
VTNHQDIDGEGGLLGNRSAQMEARADAPPESPRILSSESMTAMQKKDSRE